MPPSISSPTKKRKTPDTPHQDTTITKKPRGNIEFVEEAVVDRALRERRGKGGIAINTQALGNNPFENAVCEALMLAPSLSFANEGKRVRDVLNEKMSALVEYMEELKRIFCPPEREASTSYIRKIRGIIDSNNDELMFQAIRMEICPYLKKQDPNVWFKDYCIRTMRSCGYQDKEIYVKDVIDHLAHFMRKLALFVQRVVDLSENYK